MTMPKPTKVEKLSQDICMREIPLSEMGVPEADDYILNYCGTEFYAKQAENEAKKQKK
ncbi:MAG: DUF3330 domain-containing protein [gamma proteobacterium endosymbiont of Lamellibrachia anaximandri]|nr:DUF3330 domain-containing protein [gamma proteobacterium endosymbiont of Lamellibrachia anaximandri]MBL3532682.1 DUF3330 domain-containing protein [gamma proteobacterium endosymbiont of Lamellibrachia anaximandri]MBL3598994.1 DUF3330 domain-containing protein [gamma proteobacterium endosymbiont of Lamellibrachia anaximandri]